jgi:hypothetical protein
MQNNLLHVKACVKNDLLQLSATLDTCRTYLLNVYVLLKVQLDARAFICIIYFTRFALHVSAAICTHHQEHKLQFTAIGRCMV